MHICFLTNEYPKEGFPHGGLGSFVKTMAEALVDFGVQVTVLGLNYIAKEEQENVNGVHVIRLDKSKIKGLAWYFNSKNIAKTIAGIHKKNPIHIVEGSELSLAFLPKIKDIKYVIRLHGGHHFFAEAENRGVNWWKGFQEKRSFKKADGFIAVSKYVKEHTAKYLSYHNKSVEVIFNPINTELFKLSEEESFKKDIVFLGTICRKKGVVELIRAFPYVKEKHPEVKLHLYGRDWFDTDKKSFIEMLKTIELPKLKNLAGDVVFHGVVNNLEVPKVFEKAQVCVFPSHMETLGMVAVEAMGVGRPVVFTNTGPGKEVVIDGETGLLCNPLNPISIAEKINWYLDTPKAAEQIGKNAAEFVQENYSIKPLLYKNLDWYKQLLLN